LLIFAKIKIKSAAKNILKNAICPDATSPIYLVRTGLVLQHKVPILTKSKPRLLESIVHTPFLITMFITMLIAIFITKLYHI
jgi:hypothetical protein